jgi:hypothetical protein
MGFIQQLWAKGKETSLPVERQAGEKEEHDASTGKSHGHQRNRQLPGVKRVEDRKNDDNAHG